MAVIKRVSITETIEYVEPESMSNFSACSGVIINAPTKIFIDTNMGYEETAGFLEAEKPDVAIISHYHLDHATWAARVLDHGGSELFIPEGEENYLTSMDYFIRKTAGPYGLGEQWKEFMLNVAHYQEIDHFNTYSGQTRFKSGSLSIECIPTPGHSPAHSSFYIPEEKILITGDMGIDRFGPWYGWRDCNLLDLIESILRLRSMKVSLLLTSHGGVVSSHIRESWDRCLGKIVLRERFIADGLEKGRAKPEIVRDGIYFKNKSRVREPMRSFLFMWDSFMFDHHKDILSRTSLEKLFPELAGFLSDNTGDQRLS